MNLFQSRESDDFNERRFVPSILTDGCYLPLVTGCSFLHSATAYAHHPPFLRVSRIKAKFTQGASLLSLRAHQFPMGVREHVHNPFTHTHALLFRPPPFGVLFPSPMLMSLLPFLSWFPHLYVLKRTVARLSTTRCCTYAVFRSSSCHFPPMLVYVEGFLRPPNQDTPLSKVGTFVGFGSTINLSPEL